MRLGWWSWLKEDTSPHPCCPGCTYGCVSLGLFYMFFIERSFIYDKIHTFKHTVQHFLYLYNVQLSLIGTEQVPPLLGKIDP